MREIEFKGKSVETQEWVYGFYVQVASGEEPLLTHYIHNIDGKLVTEIEPDTLCEFTGLRDIYGRMIYESDIVQFIGHPDSPMNRFFVSVNAFTWDLLSPSQKYYRHRLETGDTMRLKVVGNLFGNPELLDEKE